MNNKRNAASAIADASAGASVTPSRTGSILDIVLTAAWFALCAGLAEDAIWGFQKLCLNKVIDKSTDFVWMAPLGAMILTGLPALGFVLLARKWHSFNPTRYAILIFAWLFFMNILFMYSGLHHHASLLLALGLAVQTSRVMMRRAAGFRVLVRRSVGWLAATVAVLSIVVQAGQLFAERGAEASLPPPPENLPNVILITLDTARARNFSLYGYQRRTTPELEKLAQKGIVFDRAISTSPWTLPSHASMFTGRLPHELSANWETPLDSTYPTLAEFLSEKGYLTAGFVANTGYCSYEHGLSRGFVNYEDYRATLGQVMASLTLGRTIADNFTLRRLMRNDEHLNRQNADDLNAKFLRWLNKAPRRPFFAFLNYYDCHEPYLPPAPFDTKFGPGRSRGKFSPLHRTNWEPAVAHRKLSPAELQEEVDAYDGALAYLDSRLGMLFDELKRQDLLENTLIIITADHGEEFGEHGLYDHGNSLYLPSVHVPLVLRYPEHVPQGQRIIEPASLVDIAATVSDLLGFGESSPFPGKSLVRYWQPSSQTDNGEGRAVYCEVRKVAGRPDWFPVSKGDMTSLILDGRRYIRNGDGSEELYDFDKDPWETVNLASSSEGRQALDRFRQLLVNTVAHRR